ncbi:MAG: hypothetical protein MJZ87_05840 [Bacteroidales bacterium]|nr:hypothetical protein [Bacteroidales bacterium]
MMKCSPFLMLLLFAGNLTLSAQHLTLKNYQKKVPAGVNMQMVADSIYYDKDDILVIDWMEYQFWLAQIYGKESPEYLAAMPDTNIIRQQVSFTEPTAYLTNPAYRHFPVFGVNPEQARAYCCWRTDRVAEYMLVQLKLREWNSEQNADNFFTIQNNDGRDGVHCGCRDGVHTVSTAGDCDNCLQWLIFTLPTETTETRYGFRCVARWL